MLPINLLAVVLAAVAAFIIGFLFHGPLFGKVWMKLANIQMTGNEKFADMIPQMLWNFLVNLVTAYVFAVIYLFSAGSSYMTSSGVWAGIVIGIWLWLGFLVTSSSISVIWMKTSKKLWLFEAASSFCVMVAMGAIIAGF